MGLFSRKKKDKGEEEKKCFNCGKKITGDGFTKAHGRYCCEKCCGNKDAGKDKTCEFC